MQGRTELGLVDMTLESAGRDQGSLREELEVLPVNAFLPTTGGL